MTPVRLLLVAVAIGLGVLLLIGTPERDATTEDVTFASGDAELAGTLSIPAGAGPHPAIALISGSGPQDRTGEIALAPGFQPFRLLAEALTARGIAVLRFDDRGVGASTGDPTDTTTGDVADDAAAAARFLREHPRIDPDRVGLLGHSEGAIAAAIVAARDPDIAWAVALAGPAVNGYELLVRQVDRILRSEGVPEEEIAAAVDAEHRVLDLALEQRWDEAEQLLFDEFMEDVATLPEEQRAALGDLETLARQRARASVDTLRIPWFAFFLRHDPSDDWEQVTSPVLALFGGLDVQVDADQNREAIEAALARGGNSDGTVITLPAANHLFQQANTGALSEYGLLPPEFAPGLLETLGDWLAARAL